MKNFRLVALLAFAALFVALNQRVVFARLTGTNPTGASADAFCAGKSGAEACVDSSGNVIPTTTNTQSLGTSSFYFSNVYGKTVTTGSGGVVLASGAPLVLPPQTTTQIQLQANPIGTLYVIQERVGGTLVTNLYNVGMSTANNVASCVYVQVSTSALAVVGASCAN